MKWNLFSGNSNAIDYLKQYSKVSAFRYIWRHKKIQTKGQSGFFKKFENLKSGGLCSKVRLQRPLEADESASLLIYRIESVSRGLGSNTSCVNQVFLVFHKASHKKCTVNCHPCYNPWQDHHPVKAVEGTLPWETDAISAFYPRIQPFCRQGNLYFTIWY